MIQSVLYLSGILEPGGFMGKESVMSADLLFSPFAIKHLTLRNRLGVAPMTRMSSIADSSSEARRKILACLCQPQVRKQNCRRLPTARLQPDAFCPSEGCNAIQTNLANCVILFGIDTVQRNCLALSAIRLQDEEQRRRSSLFPSKKQGIRTL